MHYGFQHIPRVVHSTSTLKLSLHLYTPCIYILFFVWPRVCVGAFKTQCHTGTPRTSTDRLLHTQNINNPNCFHSTNRTLFKYIEKNKKIYIILLRLSLIKRRIFFESASRTRKRKRRNRGNVYYIKKAFLWGYVYDIKNVYVSKENGETLK